MRLLVFAISFCIALSAVAEREYLVPEETLRLLSFIERPKTLSSQGGLQRVVLKQWQVERLSQEIHHQQGTCGGFIDVTDEARELEKSSFMPKRFSFRELKYIEMSKKMIGFLDRDRFRSNFEEFLKFPDRSATSKNGKAAALWLRDRAKALVQSNRKVKIELVKTGGSYIQDSVVLRVIGKDSKLPAVVIGGHLDTFGGNKPGADDDASGTITAFEIYNAILESGQHFQRDIYVIFYAAEERGLVGSGRVARLFKNRGIEVEGVMQFDMTGFRPANDRKDFYLMTNFVDKNLTRFSRNLLEQVLSIPSDRIGKTSCFYACSDHASWSRLGYSTVFPFETAFGEHNQSIHSSRDTLVKLDFDHMMKFVKLGMAFVTELAEPMRREK